MPQTKNGQQELAGTRAQLLAIQRRILEHVGETLGWKVGWAAVLSTIDPQEEFADVSLDEEAPTDDEDASDAEDSPSEKPASKASITGVSADALKDAITSIDKFRQFYEVRPQCSPQCTA